MRTGPSVRSAASFVLDLTKTDGCRSSTSCSRPRLPPPIPHRSVISTSSPSASTKRTLISANSCQDVLDLLSSDISMFCGVTLISLAVRLRTDACPRSEANGTRRAASSRGSRGHAWLHRQKALTLQLFAGELAGAANRFSFLPVILLFGRLLRSDRAASSRERRPPRCIFFFNTLRAWSTLFVAARELALGIPL